MMEKVIQFDTEDRELVCSALQFLDRPKLASSFRALLSGRSKTGLSVPTRTWPGSTLSLRTTTKRRKSAAVRPRASKYGLSTTVLNGSSAMCPPTDRRMLIGRHVGAWLPPPWFHSDDSAPIANISWLPDSAHPVAGLSSVGAATA